MMRSRFMVEQNIDILHAQESGRKTADVCRRHGKSEWPFHMSKFGGMKVSDAKRLKALETENAGLKKLLPRQCSTTPCAKISIQIVASLLRNQCNLVKAQQSPCANNVGCVPPQLKSNPLTQ